jgi:hypothetical protein
MPITVLLRKCALIYSHPHRINRFGVYFDYECAHRLKVLALPASNLRSAVIQDRNSATKLHVVDDFLVIFYVTLKELG